MKMKADRCLFLLALTTVLLLHNGPAASTPPADQALDAYLQVFPDVKNIGIIYSDKKHEDTITQLEKKAKTKDVNLIKIHAPTIKQFPNALHGMQGNADTIWVLEDPLYSIPQVWTYFVVFAIRNKIRTVVYNEKTLADCGLFYFSDDMEPVVNKRILDVLGVKVSEDAKNVKYFEPGT